MLRRRFSSILLASATAHCCFAAEKPNFSGLWLLDLKRSKMSGGQPIGYYREFAMEIQHQEPAIHIVEHVSARSQRETVLDLKTNGEWTTVLIDGNANSVSIHWDDDRLVEAFVTRQGNAKIQVFRSMALSKKGNEIWADWEFVPPAGPGARAQEIWRLVT